jgi:hypothetical protein
MITQRTPVEGLGEYVTSIGDLVTNARELKGRLASVRTDAFVRLRTAGDRKPNIGKTEGARVSLEFDYVKGAAPIVVKYNRLAIPLAQITVDANSRNQYLCTDSTKRYEEHVKRAEKEEHLGIPFARRTALILPRMNFDMSPDVNQNAFAFFLEDLAEREGENSYFVLNGRNPVTVYLINKDIIDGKKDPQLLQNPSGTVVVPYGWFWSLGDRSGLYGNGRGADDCVGRARGVLKASTEGAKPTQKTARTNILETSVLSALKKKQAFEYNGVFYVPVRGKSISLAQ